MRRRIKDGVEDINLYDMNVYVSLLQNSDEDSSVRIDEYFQKDEVMSYKDFIEICNDFCEDMGGYPVINKMSGGKTFAIAFKSLTEEGQYREGKYLGGIGISIVIPPNQITIDAIESEMDSLT